MYYLFDSITTVVQAQSSATALSLVTLCIVLGQYFILGKKMEQLLTQNISMGIIIRRLIAVKNSVEEYQRNARSGKKK